jgi:hypothetical protein
MIDYYLYFYKIGLTTIDVILLRIISYISIIIFLLLWNIKRSKMIYLLLCIPPFFTLAMPQIIHHIKYIRIQKIIEYKKSIENIPTVGEYGIALYEYWPFRNGNLLVKLVGKN